MIKYLSILFSILVFISCTENASHSYSNEQVATGQMPDLTRDASGTIHLVYGSGDSLLYSFSTNGGESFSSSTLVAVLPNLAASHTRGPQIAATSKGLVVTACTGPGNIYAFQKDPGSNNWQKPVQVNDADTVAKENLMDLSADGSTVFAVWLDLRSGHNQLYGARSIDGGQTWSKNLLVYASPDTTVCECCKPSVAVSKNKVYVMFRNWLKGNRDLYLIPSADGGNSFAEARKLGTGSWALDGCPMDGGAVAVDQKGDPQTVWNRDGVIYSCVPGGEEQPLGKGKRCTMEAVGEKLIYAWVEDGNIVLQTSPGNKKVLGQGQLPILEKADPGRVLCVWQNEGVIYRNIIAL